MVKNILGMIAGGYDIDRVLKEYTELTKEDVVAALEFATQAVDDEKIVRRA